MGSSFLVVDWPCLVMGSVILSRGVAMFGYGVVILSRRVAMFSGGMVILSFGHFFARALGFLEKFCPA